MKVRDLMSTQVVSVEMDDSLSEVKTIFESTNFHHLLVLDDNKLVGIISDRDLLKAISPNIGTLAESANDQATLNKRVHQIMSRQPITLPQTADIQDAISLFNSKMISCIPVIDESKNAVGVLSWRDILKHVN